MKTLKEEWDEQGKRVYGEESIHGWYIFIHVEDSKRPDVGYVSKWSFVVTTDNLCCLVFDLISRERVPMCFSSEKKARKWWKENECRIIKAIHYNERDKFYDFDNYKVNICKAVADFSISTEMKQ